MTTPNTDPEEQIARVLFTARYGHVRGITFDSISDEGRALLREMARAVLPIVDAAEKRGQAEALRDAADSVHDNASSPYCLPCHRDDADLIRLLADELVNGDTR